jgi:hypothetical protein
MTKGQNNSGHGKRRIENDQGQMTAAMANRKLRTTEGKMTNSQDDSGYGKRQIQK